MEEDNVKKEMDYLSEEERLIKKEEAAIRAEKRELAKETGLSAKEAMGTGKVRRLDDERREAGLERIIMHLRRRALPYTVAIILLIAINIYLRSGLLQYQGFFEPDAFFYYTAIKQAIANNFIVAKTVTLSGYPYHNGFNEAPGLPYFVLIPYFFLRYIGVSAYTIMRLVPILAGLVIAALSYYVVRYLANSRVLGLLAFFFVSASSGNVARTAGTVYRGDTFVSIFTLLVMLFILKCMKSEDESRGYFYALAAAIATAGASVSWSGGILTFAVYLASALTISVYLFVSADRKGLDRLLLLLGGLLLASLLDNIFVYAGIALPNVMQGAYFYVVFIPLLLSVLLERWVLGSDAARSISGTLARRVAFIFAVGIISAALILLLFGSTFVNAITLNGSLSPINNIAATTQELQKPSLNFLTSSFGIQLALAPLGVLIFIFLGHRGAEDTKRLKIGRISFNANYGFTVLLGYLFMTVYLQAAAIRYNAILSVPLAIFSAYCLYGVGKFLNDENYAIRLGPRVNVRLIYVYFGVVTAILVLQVGFTASQTFSSVQADGINPLFLQAMTWMSNNTAPNSTVLALWPDGSVVEGWGNRTSFMDSVGGENGSRIIPFANFLANTSPDTHYLYNTSKRPDYILVRNFWFAELGGLLAEGNSTQLQNMTAYGYAPLSTYQSSGNASDQVYQFINAIYRAELILRVNATTGAKKIAALLGAVNRTNLFEIQHILFVNTSTGNWSYVTTNATQALNYTLMISFSGRNISGATLLASALPQSNLFKILVECVPGSCAYDNPNVTLTEVYQNPDSKIFKINYLRPGG